jgi:hypothetical protein
MSGQRLIQPGDCCNLTANARESGMRALSQATHPLRGKAVAGKALGRRHREHIRPPSWWERNRGQRPRVPSRGTHPTAITPISAEKERPRRQSQAAPSGANMASRSTPASGVVPPNQRMQPDAVPAMRSRRFWNLDVVHTPSRSITAARLMRPALGGHERTM